MGKKGTLTLKIDDQKLHAYLIFTPDGDGDECTGTLVEQLLKKSEIKIIPEIKSKINDFLKKIEQSKEEISFPIAEGKPPVPPSSGLYEWKELPIPEELIPDSERIFKTALDPEIKITKVERVKVQKKILKKSKFPFKKEKEETVTVVEKREKKIPVEINPEIVALGWANTGDILGEKGAPSEGEEGVSITGDPIPPGDPVNEVFYPGNGVKSAKNIFSAQTSGFVRRGKNWIEIIPFKNHYWEVVLSKDKSTPMLNLTPGDELASPPFAKSIIKKTLELGFEADEIINENQITRIVEETIGAGAYLKDYPLSKSKDASFSITVSEDKLKGFLDIQKGSGQGKPLKLSEVGDAIKKSGFTGLNYKKIKEDLINFYHSENRTLEKYILAEGKAPGKGDKGSLKFNVSFLEAEEMKSILEEFKKEKRKTEFPLSKVQDCAHVAKNDTVALIQQSKAGVSGKDVYGNTIPGLPGDPPAINLYEHLEISDNGIVSGSTGILLLFEEDDTFFMDVAVNKQTSLQIDIDDDALRAYVTIQDGKETGITEKVIKEALAKEGIVKGIDSEIVKSIANTVEKGQNVERTLVAEGKAPVSEGKSRFKLLVDLKSRKNVSIKSNGSADYKNQNRITLVTKGTKIGVILSPDITAEDGWDVKGNVLKGQKAPPLELEIGSSIIQEKDHEGNTALIAESGGELIYDEKKISIKNTYIVKGDIDLKEGNIKFPGSVKVGGSVLPGFYIMAGGEVQVAGSINAALISSGESIIIGQGVVGGGKAVLRSKGDIDMAFAEQTTILAVGNIRIKNSCLRCKVKCNGVLSLISDKGDLVGGQIQTTGGLNAHNVGNKSNTKVQISFGQNYLIKDAIEKEEREQDKLKLQITKLDMMMGKFEKEGKKSHLAKARKQKFLIMKTMEKKGVKLFTLREKFEEHFPSEIIIRGTLFPGAVFESHDRFYETKTEKKGIRLSFNLETGRIEEEPLKKGDK